MTFPRLAAGSALLVAASNIGYATSFLVVRPDDPDTGGTAASAFLLAGGLLALPALIALYGLLRERDPQLALLATLLGIAGALGAAIHGGHDLANAINPTATGVDGPNPVDPRGLLTFGLSGLALLAYAPLLRRSLAGLAATLGVALVALYVLRLVVLDADNVAIVALAAVVGFVLSPLWYARLGLTLARPPAAPAGPRPARHVPRAAAAT